MQIHTEFLLVGYYQCGTNLHHPHQQYYYYSYYHHLSLFLFDKSKKAFTQRLTLAEWYGGESGQVLTGSWMFDYDKDGHYDIVRREIAHSSMLVGDDVQEHFDESAALFLWKNDGFEAAPVADSAAMIKRYPIKSKW